MWQAEEMALRRLPNHSNLVKIDLKGQMQYDAGQQN
jgi:hypothetical protein